MKTILKRCFCWLYHSRKQIYIILIIIFLLRFTSLNIYNWYHGNTGRSGIQMLTDSYRYIEASEYLMKGCLPDYKQCQYLGYSAFLALLKLSGFGLAGVILVQLSLALISAFLLYKLAFHLGSSRLAGIIAAGLYLTNPFINQWHLYIMTESVYTSMLIITTYLLSVAIETKQAKNFLFLLPSFLFTFFIRPNGWILLPLMVAFIMAAFLKKSYMKFFVFFASFFVFFIVIRYLPFTRYAIDNIGTEKIRMNTVFLSGEVIPDHKELRLSMPYDSTLEKKSWTEAAEYILKHPFSCIKLSIVRIVTELFQINRPWMSMEYRLRLYFWLFPAYCFAFVGFIKYRKRILTKIIFVIICLHLLIIGLTFADHEGRFLNYFLPLIYVLSGAGVTFVSEKILKKVCFSNNTR